MSDKKKPVLGAIREVKIVSNDGSELGEDNRLPVTGETQILLADGTAVSASNRLPVTLETEITSIPVGDVWVGIEEGTDLGE